MLKNKFCLVFLAFILAILLLLGGLAQAQENEYNNFTYQYFTTNSASNYIFYEQGISGIVVPNFSDAGSVNVTFNDFIVNGVYNASYGIGSYRNQGSLAFVNIQPGQELTPANYLGQTFSANNKVNIQDYNYSINLNFNGFRGSGIVVLNLMAGSFSNQFTSVHFSMGKKVSPPPSTTGATLLRDSNSTLAILSNAQMQTIAAAANNDIQIRGKQSAIATVEGTPQIQGVCAITMSSGVNNLISHRVGVNIDTAP